MTLDEAIEHLEHVKQRAKREGNMGTYDAAQLGVEALKQMKAERSIYGFQRHVRMLGETEE